MGQESFCELLQALVPATSRVSQNPFDVGTQYRVSPAKSGGRLGSHRIAVIRPFEECKRSGSVVGWIRAGGERVAPRLILTVFIHECA
jgi:hypothetical protein